MTFWSSKLTVKNLISHIAPRLGLQQSHSRLLSIALVNLTSPVKIHLLLTIPGQIEGTSPELRLKFQMKTLTLKKETGRVNCSLTARIRPI